MLRFVAYIDGKELLSGNTGDEDMAKMLEQFRRMANGGKWDAIEIRKPHRVILEWTSDHPKHESMLP